MNGTLSEGSSDLEYVCLENGDYNLELDVADDDGAEGDDASADDGTGDDDTSAARPSSCAATCSSVPSTRCSTVSLPRQSESISTSVARLLARKSQT